MSEWFKITDITTGSALFSGSPVYAFVRSATYSGGNNIGNSPIQGSNTEIDEDLDGVGDSAVSSNFSRRVGYNSYSSFNNPIIKLTGTWVEEVGSVNNMGKILTPYKLWRMIHSDHQFKLEGGITIPNLLAGEDSTGYYYPSLEGMPVVFDTPWQIKESYPDGTNKVVWTATLKLDREE